MYRFALAVFAWLPALAAEPALLRYTVPAPAVIGGVRMAEIRDSAFGRFLLKEFAGEGPEFENFVKATGFDPRRDVFELLYSAPAGSGWLLAARGRFPILKLLTLGKMSGAQVATVDGVQVVSTTASEGSLFGRAVAFAFLDPTTALAGDETSVRRVIARRRAPGGPPMEMAARASQLAATWPGWFVASDFSAVAGATPLSEGMQKLVQRASGGFRFGDTIGLNAEMITRTPQDAKTLAEFLRFLSKMGAEAPDAQAAAIGEMLSTAQVTVAGTSVKLGLTIPEAAAEALVNEGRIEEPAP